MEACVANNADLTAARDLLDQGRLDDAAASCRAVLARDVGDIAALHMLGVILLRQGAASEAVPVLAAVAEMVTDASVLSDLGEALLAVGLSDEAASQFRAAIVLDPDSIAANYNFSCLLQAWGDHADSVPLLRKVLDRQADFADAWLALGNAFLHGDRLAEAEDAFRRAVAVRPDFVEALNNLGNALVGQLRLEEARLCYTAALAFRPEAAGTEFALALALLLAGDFAAGWPHFEARRNYAALRWNYERRLELPQWHPGLSLAGRRVLLTAEQGAGDVVQFVRYAPILAAEAACVVVELPADLHAVFADLPGASRVVGLDETVTDCDIVCPLLSLPGYFATELTAIPARVPYATVPGDRRAAWRDWLGPPQGRRIGIVCSGRPTHPHDRHRSIPLAHLSPILAAPDCEFVLLQPDLHEADAAVLAATPTVRWPGTALRDFGDTAALLAECDLLIGVDTSVAHLAGALARPVWLMLPFAPDWRWLLGRCDTPWYPTMRLYRQPTFGDWDTVITQVRRDLDGRR
ncbi:MAG TPA: tetratricopeptide repeat protein [Acetobacteraceae bacterium]|jgi:tetratricopeptide (TPR) repeat protein